MEKLWTTCEAAQCLGVAEEDVEQLVREGQLTGYRLGGKFLRFRPDQVQHLKGTMRFRPTSVRTGTYPTRSASERVKEFWYFYDYYFVSACLLAAVVLYLVL